MFLGLLGNTARLFALIYGDYLPEQDIFILVMKFLIEQEGTERLKMLFNIYSEHCRLLLLLPVCTVVTGWKRATQEQDSAVHQVVPPFLYC